LDIFITTGKGEGNTKLSAFDQALFKAGIANYNLLPLSSVIPPNVNLKIENINWNNREHGHKLYVVISRIAEDVPGKEVWAGVGWVQVKNEDSRGLFVEHQAESEEKLIELIENSLNDMVVYREGEFTKPQYVTCGIKCVDKPVSAIVAAVYKSESWE